MKKVLVGITFLCLIVFVGCQANTQVYELIETLGSTDKTEVKNTLNELKSIGEPAVVPIIEKMEQDTKNKFLIPGSIGLLAIGEPSVTPLINVLKDSNKRFELRAIAARTLADLKDPRAVDPLYNILTDKSESGTLRKHCGEMIMAMAKNGVPEAREAMLKYIKE
jgi:hypothetical protein